MRLPRAKCVWMLMLCAVEALAEKQYRSPEEFELYTAVTKAFAAGDFPKVLSGLDVWKAKFPETDFASNRQQLYVHAFARSSQASKAVLAAKPVLAGPFDTPDDELRLLYAVVTAMQQLPSPAAEERAIAQEAAQRLMKFDMMPAGMSSEEWNRARGTLRTTASVALLHAALTPVREAVLAKDCAAAERDGLKVVQEYPESAQAAWVLASAQLCLTRTNPAKFPSALFLLARAASVEAGKGLVDPAWQSGSAAPYLEKVYTQYHGNDPEGLRALKALSLKTPLPPEGFTIASAAEVAQGKQADFESKNPELALWMRIKGALSAANGDTYFATELKGVALPPLKAFLIEGRPACGPRELLVSLSGPKEPVEAVLRLSTPLRGSAVHGSEFLFEGVAAGFVREPFRVMLTVESDKIGELKMNACTPAPASRRQ